MDYSKEIFNTPIEKVGFSIPTYWRLKRKRLHTLEDVCKFRGDLGTQKARLEVTDKLIELGIYKIVEV